MRWILLILVCCALAAQTIPEDRVKDAYAVYSALLADSGFSHPEANRQFLISGMTGLESARQPLPGCVQAPAKDAARFDEVLEDYRNHKGDRLQLERKFEVEKPYELLNEAEVRLFQKSRVVGRLSSAPPEPEKFQGVVHLFTFSNVYFDHARSMAVVRTDAWCGGLCDVTRWRVLLKADGQWREQHWTTCISVARLGDQRLGVVGKEIPSILGSTATSK